MAVRFSIAAIAALATISSAHAESAMPGGAPVLPSGISFNVSVYGAAGTGKVTAGSTGSWNIDFYGAEAHAGMLNGTIGIQADVWGTATHYIDNNAINTYGHFLAAGLHINQRTDNGLVGAMFSVATAPEGYRATLVNAALEASRDFGRVTLGAQVGYTKTVATNGVSAYSISGPSAVYADGVARWFPRDNLMLAGDLGYTAQNGQAGETADATRWGARVEWQPRTSPVSFFAAYQGYVWHQQYTAVVNAAVVGLTFTGGGETLIQRYRGPAGLADLNPVYGVNFAE
jgi:hypothetical protein